MRQLEFALAVQEAGAICAAAKHLHISQPSLSQQLTGLERTLGVSLFTRTPSGTRPTEAGLTFLAHAENALREIQRARESVASPPQHVLRVGVEDLVDVRGVITAAHEAFGHQTATSVRILRFATSARLTEALASQEIDMAVGEQPDDPGNGVHLPLGAVNLVLMCAPDVVSVGLRQVVWFQVEGTERHVARLVQSVMPASVLPDIGHADTYEIAAEMAAQGLGVALVPERWGQRGLVVHATRVPKVSVPIAVLMPDGDGRAAILASALRRLVRGGVVS